MSQSAATFRAPKILEVSFVAGVERTKLQCVQDPFVEQDNRGTQADPNAVYGRVLASPIGAFRELGSLDLRDVDGRGNGRLRGLRLLRVRVDGRQHGSILLPHDLARGALLLSHLV